MENSRIKPDFLVKAENNAQIAADFEAAIVEAHKEFGRINYIKQLGRMLHAKLLTPEEASDHVIGFIGVQQTVATADDMGAAWREELLDAFMPELLIEARQDAEMIEAVAEQLNYKEQRFGSLLTSIYFGAQPTSDSRLPH